MTPARGSTRPGLVEMAASVRPHDQGFALSFIDDSWLGRGTRRTLRPQGEVCPPPRHRRVLPPHSGARGEVEKLVSTSSRCFCVGMTVGSGRSLPPWPPVCGRTIRALPFLLLTTVGSGRGTRRTLRPQGEVCPPPRHRRVLPPHSGARGEVEKRWLMPLPVCGDVTRRAMSSCRRPKPPRAASVWE